jgi:hypothetical protein
MFVTEATDQEGLHYLQIRIRPKPIVFSHLLIMVNHGIGMLMMMMSRVLGMSLDVCLCVQGRHLLHEMFLLHTYLSLYTS